MNCIVCNDKLNGIGRNFAVIIVKVSFTIKIVTDIIFKQKGDIIENLNL